MKTDEEQFRLVPGVEDDFWIKTGKPFVSYTQADTVNETDLI